MMIKLIKTFGREITSTYRKEYLVNDSPSLNKSSVGIAMGSGTNIAKEAADIVLLDDAFPSIVTGVKWGRSLYKNIQSFLVYQLIINVAVCLVSLFSPLLGIDGIPFSIPQILFINLAMDTIAALGLSSQAADSNVLNNKPRGIKDFIINSAMAKTILGFGFVVFIALSVIVSDIAKGSPMFGLDLSELYALFMIICWWNLFNIRVFGKNRSVFHELFKNKKFVLSSAIILLGTIGIVQFGGEVFSTRPLSFTEWIIILAATSPVMIVRELYFQLRKK